MRIYLFNFHKIKNPLLAILYIGLATIIFTAVLVKPDETLPVRAKPQAISKVRTSQKVAALTFNISWGSKVPVLDILKTHNQQATFFISSA